LLPFSLEALKERIGLLASRKISEEARSIALNRFKLSSPSPRPPHNSPDDRKIVRVEDLFIEDDAVPIPTELITKEEINTQLRLHKKV